MRLIRLAVVLALSLFAAPLGAEGQQAGKVFRIGVLFNASPAENPSVSAFDEGLRELGYVEGKNIVFERRYAKGKVEQFPDLASELARFKVDVIVTAINPAVAAAQRATTTIPIVMVLATDPVGVGFVASLARPGGNITGLSSQSKELQGKAIQLLREAAPTMSRIAVLWDPTESGRRDEAREAEVAARVLGVQPQLLEVRNPSELDSAFAAMTGERIGVLMGLSSMLYIHRARVAELAAKNRLPTMCMGRWYVEAGCLMSYSADAKDLFRRSATYVDKILKGAKPADLPVEQPTKFELVINLKTAKALGLTIPQTIILQADQVIE